MKIYDLAVEVLSLISQRGTSLKSAVYSGSQTKDLEVGEKKRVFALVCQYLKYRNILKEILSSVKLGNEKKEINSKKGSKNGEKEMSEADKKQIMLELIVYDLLFGKGIEGKGALQQKVSTNQVRLQSELARMKIKKKVMKNEDLLPEHLRNPITLPKYVRVNTLKAQPNDVLKHFLNLNYKEVESQEELINSTSKQKLKQVMKDKDLDELLIFSPHVDFHLEDIYQKGEIIIQDKASCFPAKLLSPELNSTVIDACAAPGNKTSHLAAIMKNTGKIFAFDLSQQRLKLLQNLTSKAGAKNIEAINQSFLNVDVKDKKFESVEYILLDPSCSGSGIVGRQNELTDQLFKNESETNDQDLEYEEETFLENEEDKRIQGLADFQLTMLLHALSFPKVKRVVYSTCSVHQQENEDVVMKALQKNSNFQLVNAFPTWPTRGFSTFNGGEFCVRTNPKEDHTIGFFVALFERKQNLDASANLKENNLKRKAEEPVVSDDKKKKKKKKKNKSNKLESV